MPTIRAGDLRDVVTLKTTTGAVDGSTEATVRTQRCEIEPLGGKAIEIARAQGKETTDMITFRDKPVVLSTYIIVDGDGRRFTIDWVKQFPRDKQQAFVHISDRANT